jgi:hypothetical protein
MNEIYKILKIENNVYLAIAVLLIVSFIVNVSIIGVCPFPDCIHQVYKENTSNLYIKTYYLALYGLPLWVILTSFSVFFYLIFKKIITKNIAYNKLILRFLLYIFTGFAEVIIFIFFFANSYSNGSFDILMFPKDSGELFFIVLIIISLILRKILCEKHEK